MSNLRDEHHGMEQIAHLLEVDEVQIHHGPRGMAIYERVGRDWVGTTIEKSELEDTHDRHRLLGGKLEALADKLVLRKSRQGGLPVPVRSDFPAWGPDDLAMQEYRTRRSYNQPSQPAQFQPESLPDPEPVADGPRMGSRFEAIVAELKNL